MSSAWLECLGCRFLKTNLREFWDFDGQPVSTVFPANCARTWAEIALAHFFSLITPPALLVVLMVPVFTCLFCLSDVEGITQKTGSAKKFPVFVKMLLDALGVKHGSSETVFADLLTYADLVSNAPVSSMLPSSSPSSWPPFVVSVVVVLVLVVMVWRS